jgi:hypothetical protein
MLEDLTQLDMKLLLAEVVVPQKEEEAVEQEDIEKQPLEDIQQVHLQLLH